jgi:hypothetical protein
MKNINAGKHHGETLFLQMCKEHYDDMNWEAELKKAPSIKNYR